MGPGESRCLRGRRWPGTPVGVAGGCPGQAEVRRRKCGPWGWRAPAAGPGLCRSGPHGPGLGAQLFGRAFKRVNRSNDFIAMKLWIVCVKFPELSQVVTSWKRTV